MTRYYRRVVTIVDAEQLGGVMLKKLAEHFDEEEHLAHPRRTPPPRHPFLVAGVLRELPQAGYSPPPVLLVAASGHADS